MIFSTEKLFYIKGRFLQHPNMKFQNRGMYRKIIDKPDAAQKGSFPRESVVKIQSLHLNGYYQF